VKSKLIVPTLIDLPVELRGERIVLRPYCADDAESVFAAIDESRDHLRPWLPWVERHSSMDDTRDYCMRCAANWLLRSDLTLGIFQLDNGRYLGGTGLHNPNWTLRSFEIGYWLRVAAEGRGFMTETVTMLSAFAFDHLKANRVEISCVVRNERSRAVAERCGFVLEGRLRNVFLDAKGDPVDGFVFSRLPGDADPSGAP
jgi:ribosomal-protein-serine acetyltransferase